MPDNNTASTPASANQQEAPPGGPGVIGARNTVPDPGQRGIASGGLGGEADPAGTRLGGQAVPVMPGEPRMTGGTNPTAPGGPDQPGLGGAATNDALPGGGPASDDDKLPNQR